MGCSSGKASAPTEIDNSSRTDKVRSDDDAKATLLGSQDAFKEAIAPEVCGNLCASGHTLVEGHLVRQGGCTCDVCERVVNQDEVMAGCIPCNFYQCQQCLNKAVPSRPSIVAGSRVVATTEITYSEDLSVPQGTFGTVVSALHTNLWVNWDGVFLTDDIVVLASMLELVDEHNSGPPEQQALLKGQQSTSVQESAESQPALARPADASKEPSSQAEGPRMEASNDMALRSNEALQHNSAIASSGKTGAVAAAPSSSEANSKLKSEEKAARKEKPICCC